MLVCSRAVVVGIVVAALPGALHQARAVERRIAKTEVDSRSVEAAGLVRQALVAESSGNLAQRKSYLDQALAADPNYAPAHWQLGEVRVGDAWLAVESAANENAWSGKFVKYRQLRDASPATAEAHLKLARWCDEAGLPVQEQMHLWGVLRSRPSKSQQRDAIAKLGLVRYQRRLVPAATAEALKREAKDAETAMQKWKPLLNRLRGDLESRDTVRQEDAAAQLRALGDAAAIPAIEAVFAKSTAPAGKAAVGGIAAIKGQAATDSLVRHAVLAKHEEVRTAAAEALRHRDVFSYVPTLLSGMNSPIEISFQSFGSEGGAFGERLSLYREGLFFNASTSSGITAMAGFVPEPGAIMVPQTGAAERAVAQRAASDAQVAQAAVEENARVEAMNQRIAAALRISTGNDSLDDDAKSCWDWWFGYNETYLPADKPLYETNRQSYVYYSAIALAPSAPSASRAPQRSSPPPAPSPAPSRRGGYECFVPGTPVWTVTGTVPIEKIQAGDLVLAQNVDTGELAYQPVMTTTTGPALPIVETRVGRETIRSTRGHLFWVSGTGWRMAKELQAGQLLHTAGGALPIESVEEVGESVCHNLIIPEFNTYFVTNEKVLVHDIDFRSPTTAKVPGLTEE